MENFVVVDGLRTRYVKEGSGTTVLLLHGLALGSSLEVYAKSIPIFAKAGLRAIAYDLPAFGLTGQPQDYSDEFRKSVYLEVLGRAGNRRDLHGWSFECRDGPCANRFEKL